MSALALQNQVEYTLSILSGPNKGEVFKLVSTTITIGRSSNNDICLANDTKCSRQHAEIHISSTGIIIKSLNPKNMISVDGQQAEVLFLNHDSKITIGSTKILFQISMFIKDTPPGALQGFQSDPNKGVGPVRAQSIPRSEPHFHPKKQGLNIKWILVGALIIIIIFALTEESQKNSIKQTLRTDKQIENEIEAINSLREAELKRRNESGINSEAYEQAQSHYIIGFRDYKKGKYERAVASFQACITLFPAHDLCRTYMNLSQKKFQELIQYHMIQGNKYTENGQYAACITSFKNVLYMVKDKNNKVYTEADSKRKNCEVRLGGRF